MSSDLGSFDAGLYRDDMIAQTPLFGIRPTVRIAVVSGNQGTILRRLRRIGLTGHTAVKPLPNTSVVLAMEIKACRLFSWMKCWSCVAWARVSVVKMMCVSVPV